MKTSHVVQHERGTEETVTGRDMRIRWEVKVVWQPSPVWCPG